MNGWRRTSICLTESDHSVRVITPDGRGWSSKQIRWPAHCALVAQAFVLPDGRWEWRVRVGSKVIGTNTAKSEALARSAAMRVVKKHRTAMRLMLGDEEPGLDEKIRKIRDGITGLEEGTKF